MSPMLVAVTGPDGAGKTSLCRHLAATCEGGARVVQIWDALPGLPLVGPARDYLADLGPLARGTFLMHAVARALERGQRSGARILLLDGYWYKYAASELAFGDDLGLLLGRRFPKPQHTFSLDLPPEEALRRRPQPSAYEQGLPAPGTSADAAFLGFQRRTRAAWARVEAEAGPWVHLDATRPLDELSAEVWERVPR